MFSSLKEKFSNNKFGQRYLKIDKRITSGFWIFLAFILITLICDAACGWQFIQGTNLLLVAKNSTFCILAGFGMMFIFSGGLIDLSVGSNILLSASLGVLAATAVGDNVGGLIVLLLVTVICSVIFGQISVQLSLTLKIPSWIAGLAAGLILEAVFQIYVNLSGTIPTLANTTVLKFFSSNGGMWIILLIPAVIAFFLFNKTTIGINLQAVGRNPNVSQNMGINSKKTILISTLIGGIFVGLAALFNVSYNSAVSPQLNLGSLSIIFKVLATIMLADAMANIFTQPIAIVIASLIINVVMSLFGFLTGINDINKLNLFLGIIVILSGVLSHLKTKSVVK